MANLKQIYDEAVQHNHESALAAIETAVRAEVNAARDEIEQALTGVNVRDLLAENEQLKAQVADLTKKIAAGAVVAETPVATPLEPAPTETVSQPAPTV